MLGLQVWLWAVEGGDFHTLLVSFAASHQPAYFSKQQLSGHHARGSRAGVPANCGQESQGRQAGRNNHGSTRDRISKQVSKTIQRLGPDSLKRQAAQLITTGLSRSLPTHLGWIEQGHKHLSSSYHFLMVNEIPIVLLSMFLTGSHYIIALHFFSFFPFYGRKGLRVAKKLA